MDSLMFRGWKRPLEDADLFDLEGDLLADDISLRFDRAWENELLRPKPSLPRALFVTFGKEIAMPGIPRLIGDTANILSPLVVLNLILYLQNDAVASKNGSNPPPVWEGYLLALLLFVMQFFLYGFKKLEKTAIIAALYKKCMRLSPLARQIHSSGKIVNLISTDAARLDRSIAFLHFAWCVPYQIILAMIILFSQLGWTAFVGCIMIIIVAPVQLLAQRYLTRMRREASLITDIRMRTTQEVIQGVRVCKFYAWEKPFIKVIEDLRSKEILKTRKMLIIRALISSIVTLMPTLSSVVMFVLYVYAGNTLNYATVFSVLTLTNILRIPLLTIPIFVNELTDSKIALDRIQVVMLADELDSPPTILPENHGSDIPAISVKNASFAWNIIPTNENQQKIAVEDETGLLKEKYPVLDQSPTLKETLSDINFTIPKGKLVAIIGSVGSGKSSLLQGLIGEMKRLEGSVEFCGSVGIQNTSLKNNILFGIPFDQNKYKNALRSCALESDLTVLPAGDETEIGERGINLSGGQKQRVSLARA
ncbi:hypothetical protein HK096_006556, partial [Nowakowskiella sp. JEL0078]